MGQGFGAPVLGPSPGGVALGRRSSPQSRARASLLRLAALLFLTCVGGARAQVATLNVGNPFGVSVAPDGSIWAGLYDQGAFAIISPDATKVTGTIVTPPNPTQAVFSGNLAIFASEYGHQVYAIDAKTGDTQWTLRIRAPTIASVAISPTGVGYATSDPGTLTAFNPSTGVITGTMAIGLNPRGMAFSADGSIIAVVNRGAATLDIIDAKSMTISYVAPIGGAPRNVAISGMFAYTANFRDSTISKVNIDTGAVTSTLSVGLHPRRIVASGNRLFVSNQGDNSISVINTVNFSTIRTISLPGSPRGLALSPNGRRLYVADRADGAILTYNVGQGRREGRRRSSAEAPQQTSAAPIAAPGPPPPQKSNNHPAPLIDVMFVLAEWRF